MTVGIVGIGLLYESSGTTLLSRLMDRSPPNSVVMLHAHREGGSIDRLARLHFRIAPEDCDGVLEALGVCRGDLPDRIQFVGDTPPGWWTPPLAPGSR